ncbi:MAG: cell surface protein SprA, partial [Flavobacteriales bacterium]
MQVQGGAQTKNFEVKADQYEDNRHFFLSQYFRDNYNDALASLPVINSQIKITRVEVWVTNNNSDIENTRNIVALSDLGEGKSPSNRNYINPDAGITEKITKHDRPDNGQNNLYEVLSNKPKIRGFFDANQLLNNIKNPFGPLNASEDYEKVENARKLSSDEYTFNEKLGFISLNRSLDQDEVLAVAYEYSYKGETNQVGEFSTDGVDGQDALVLKMLKSTSINPNIPLWDLMMKNVYSIGAFGVQKKDFNLKVLYKDPKQGIDINYIPQEPIKGTPLIQVLEADNMDINKNRNPDGKYDFVDNASTKGGTINSKNGRIFFPVVEPFGDNLRRKFEKAGVDENVISNIAYEPLYDSTKTAAQQIPELNRFIITGSYKSESGSEIQLNAMNIPQGSIKVTAGGMELEEGVDYTVDYTLGRVKIINEGLLQSQTPINVSLESNSMFSIQSKRLMGSRFDYMVSDKFNIGGTIMNLSERPLTRKVNIGNEPINNTIWGVDFDYSTESKLITNLVDKLPLIDTKEKSTLDVSGEFAHLIPGHNDAVGDKGVSYVDDFEGSQTSIDVRTSRLWNLASTPQGQENLFPEGEFSNDLRYGYNRARLSWYVIDPLFFRN